MLDDTNREYICKDDLDLCLLNSKGIDSGIDSVVFNIELIKKDYLNIYPVTNISEIEPYFETQMFMLANSEIEKIISEVDLTYLQNLGADMET